MKLILTVFALVLLFPVLSLKAQNNIQSSGSVKNVIEYQWPMDGNDYVPQKTTFIVRLYKFITNSHRISDFSFSVTGDKSGNHLGKIFISDDDQTIIFRPNQAFALNETVNVSFNISGAENLTPMNFSFHTTSMSEEDRGRALYVLHQNEQEEYQAFLNQSPDATEATLPLGHDTVAGLPPQVAIVIDTTTTHEEGNIFFSPTGGTTIAFSFLGILNDTESSALFERDIPIGCGNFRMQPDGTLTYFRQVFRSPIGGVFQGQIDHLDKNMRIIDTFECIGYQADLHDFHLLPNGHSILLAYDPQRDSMTKYLDTVQGGTYKSLASKASDTAIVYGAIIQELDQNKHLVFQWRSWDHFQIIDATRDILMTTKAIDYMHINTAMMDTDGNIIASFRHQDEVSKISHSDGSFIWHWGGKHNQFIFSGIDADDTIQFSHQHDPERIANGHITIFDNGNLHPRVLQGNDTTRALEYDLNESQHKATVLWRFMKLPYCLAAGNTQRLDNGNTMIGLGITVQPSAVEVTPTGEKVFQMSISKGAFSYRTYRFPFSPTMSVMQTGQASSFSIGSIYPNPAQNAATISFSVGDPGMMQIELLNVLGHSVRTITEKLSNAGTYSANLDLDNLPNGTYYCKLMQNGNAAMKMIVLQK